MEDMFLVISNVVMRENIIENDTRGCGLPLCSYDDLMCTSFDTSAFTNINLFTATLLREDYSVFFKQDPIRCRILT